MIPPSLATMENMMDSYVDDDEEDAVVEEEERGQQQQQQCRVIENHHVHPAWWCLDVTTYCGSASNQANGNLFGQIFGWSQDCSEGDLTETVVDNVVEVPRSSSCGPVFFGANDLLETYYAARSQGRADTSMNIQESNYDSDEDGTFLSDLLSRGRSSPFGSP